MVYAVAMKTIASFEQALGRRVQWSPRDLGKQAETCRREQYVGGPVSNAGRYIYAAIFY